MSSRNDVGARVDQHLHLSQTGPICNNGAVRIEPERRFINSGAKSSRYRKVCSGRLGPIVLRYSIEVESHNAVLDRELINEPAVRFHNPVAGRSAIT